MRFIVVNNPCEKNHAFNFHYLAEQQNFITNKTFANYDIGYKVILELQA